jgi:hypothetical protein
MTSRKVSLASLFKHLHCQRVTGAPLIAKGFFEQCQKSNGLLMPIAKGEQEALHEVDSCPLCKRWMGHNRPPADDAGDQPPDQPSSRDPQASPPGALLHGAHESELPDLTLPPHPVGERLAYRACTHKSSTFSHNQDPKLPSSDARAKSRSSTLRENRTSMLQLGGPDCLEARRLQWSRPVHEH